MRFRMVTRSVNGHVIVSSQYNIEWIEKSPINENISNWFVTGELEYGDAYFYLTSTSGSGNEAEEIRIVQTN